MDEKQRSIWVALQDFHRCRSCNTRLLPCHDGTRLALKQRRRPLKICQLVHVHAFTEFNSFKIEPRTAQ